MMAIMETVGVLHMRKLEADEMQNHHQRRRVIKNESSDNEQLI